MDTIVSTGSRSIILTIVEKSTSMIFMEKMDKKKNAKETSRAVVRLLLPIKEYVKSITTDNRSEFSEHMYIARKLNKRPREKLQFNAPLRAFAILLK